MSRFRQCILGAAAMTVVAGCSGSERGAPEALASQGQALKPASVALIPATLSDTGKPVRTNTAPVMPVSGSASAAQPSLGDPNERTKLRGIALGIASAAGVSAPKTMHVVAASDHQAAESIVSGAVIHDHAPVYVVKMTGGPFTATQHPPGIAAAQGNVLTVTIDVATHRVTDVGYVDAEPDLTSVASSPVDLLAP